MSELTSGPVAVEYGVFDIPLRLDTTLEPQRNLLQTTLLTAQRRLKTFAQQHSWLAYVAEPFAQKAQFYATKASFDHDLLTLCGLDPTIELPSTYCGALEQGVLTAVSPHLYRALYPQGDEPDAFEKLLTHEMAHRLHIRILAGDEEAMGPVWFYEGFALHAAGQLANAAPKLEIDEIWAIVQEEERMDYRRYVTVLRYFLQKATMHQLVEQAGQEDFVAWLRQISQ